MSILISHLGRVSLALFLLYGCFELSHEGQRPAQAGSAAAAAQVTAAPAKPSREELLKNALASIGRIQGELAKLRGLPFSKNVEAEHQSQEDFRKFVKSEIHVDLPSQKSEALARAAFHIGLLKEKLDLSTTIEDALVGQAGAYYDPQTKKFYIVMIPQSELLLNVLSSHELTHALQDQHFDLTAYMGGRGNSQGLSEDELNARRFIVEGEATVTMMAYQTQAMTKVNLLDPDRTAQARVALNQAARVQITQLKEMQKQQSQMFVDIGEDIKNAIDAIDKIPLYILVPLVDAYFKGALPVFEAYAHGGWESVADLYKTPPDSTEQVLHPVEKLIGKRDYPIKLVLPAPGKNLVGWKELYSDVLGELLWRVYFMNWGGSYPEAQAAGWDGDRYVVYAKGEQTIGFIATTWDSPVDAARFADAYVATLNTRFPGGAALQSKGYRRVARPEGTVVVVEQNQNNVYIVDGCDERDVDALLAMMRNTRAERHPAEK